MRPSFETFVAKRFLGSKASNGYLSFMTWISLIGLVIGVSALIIVTSVLNGFEEVLTERIMGMVPHSSVNKADGIDDWQQYGDKILKNDSNVRGVAPFFNTRGMSSIDGQVHGTIINGIDHRYQGEVSILPEVMVQGSLNTLKAGQYNIVLGEHLVKERGIKIGDKVTIMLVQPNDTSIGVDPKFHIFTLSGVFSISEEVDSWLSYINIEDATFITKSANKPNGLRLNLQDIMQAKTSANKAKQVFEEQGIDVWVMTWQDTHRSLYESIQQQKRMMVLLLFLIIVVAVFNVVSSLVMITTEKQSQIAILKTFGASEASIIKIFVIQGMLIGLIGTLIGLTVGISISLIIGDVSSWVDKTFSLGLFDNYYVTALPSKLNGIEVALIVAVSIAVCTVASIYPARKAANRSPIEGLKYD